jgi:hypothetical protein
MKKIVMLVMFLISSLVGFSQSCYTPPNNGVFVTIDSSYLLGTVAAGNTKVGLCFYNNTASKITATQFRVFYDTTAFSKIDTITSFNTSFPQALSYVDNRSGGYVTITFTYTGSLSTFGLSNGAFLQIQFHHVTNYASLTSVSNLTFAGTPTFPTLATTQSGMDTVLNLYNFGGVMKSQTMSYHGRFVNVTGTGAKNLTLSLEKKLRPSGSWVQVTTRITDTSGSFAFTKLPIDTTGYDVRLNVKGDTMAVGNVISVSDAQRINQYVLGTATPSGFDYYSSDANGDNSLSISDVYSVFGKVAGRFTTWPNSLKDIKFFTTSEYTTINNSSTNYTSSIPGVTNFQYNIVAGQPDSVTYYVLIPGDANGTGYHMARLIPIEILNASHANLHIIDLTTKYDDEKRTVELNYPDLSVDEQNLVNVPVKVKTGDVDLGSLQLSIKYDSTLLDFKGIKSESSVSGWVTFLNPNNGEIEWGGYDPTNNTKLLKDQDMAFTLQFVSKKVQNEWEESPLYVTRKFAGDHQAKDLNILPTNKIVTVYKTTSPTGLLSEQEDIRVYPNPTNDYIRINFRVRKDGMVWIGIYDNSGKECKVIINEEMPKGVYEYGSSLGYLPAGEYYAIMKKNDVQLSKKVIKN